MSRLVRRVYMLAPALHDRVRSFCERDQISEVEGIRRLLSFSLDQYEEADEFEARVRKMRPVDAAFASCGHPLVQMIAGNEKRTQITLRNGTVIEVA